MIEEAKSAKEVTAVDYRNSPSIVEGDDLKHDYFFPPTHSLSFDTHIGMSKYGLLAGLQFFDKDNNVLLEAGFCGGYYDEDDDDDEKRCDIKKRVFTSRE